MWGHTAIRFINVGFDYTNFNVGRETLSHVRIHERGACALLLFTNWNLWRYTSITNSNHTVRKKITLRHILHLDIHSLSDNGSTLNILEKLIDYLLISLNKNTFYIYTHRSTFHNFIYRQFFTADCEEEQNRILSFTKFTTLSTWTGQFICIRIHNRY